MNSYLIPWLFQTGSTLSRKEAPTGELTSMEKGGKKKKKTKKNSRITSSESNVNSSSYCL